MIRVEMITLSLLTAYLKGKGHRMKSMPYYYIVSFVHTV